MTKKVKVPKSYASYLEVIKDLSTSEKLFLVSRAGWGYRLNVYHPEASRWVVDNKETAIRAILDGYEIEEEREFYLKATGLPEAVHDEVAYLNYREDIARIELGDKSPYPGYRLIFTEPDLVINDIDETGFTREYLED